MIDFTTVSREFNSLVTRRREQMTFLGSVFAALSIFLQNALQGNLPPGLDTLESHLFAFYALLLLVPSLILALRMARLHAGMVINGILFARLMQHQDFTQPGNPDRAARHNFVGVSFLYCLLADVLAGFAATLLVFALGFAPWLALSAGVAVVVAWLGLYFRFHSEAVWVARRKLQAQPCGPVRRDEWEDHISTSLEEANLGMIADIAFAGLILFSVFEALSSLDAIGARTELSADQVRFYGPWAFALLLVFVCLSSLLTYLRVRVAVGRFSLMLDPNDTPFRTLRLTDSLLGYLLLAFFLAVSVHLIVIQIWPLPALGSRVYLAIGLGVVALAVAVEQLTLLVAGRHSRRVALPVASSPPTTNLISRTDLTTLPMGAPEVSGPPADSRGPDPTGV